MHHTMTWLLLRRLSLILNVVLENAVPNAALPCIRISLLIRTAAGTWAPSSP